MWLHVNMESSVQTCTSASCAAALHPCLHACAFLRPFRSRSSGSVSHWHLNWQLQQQHSSYCCSLWLTCLCCLHLPATCIPASTCTWS